MYSNCVVLDDERDYLMICVFSHRQRRQYEKRKVHSYLSANQYNSPASSNVNLQARLRISSCVTANLTLPTHHPAHSTTTLKNPTPTQNHHPSSS